MSKNRNLVGLPFSIFLTTMLSVSSGKAGEIHQSGVGCSSEVECRILVCSDENDEMINDIVAHFDRHNANSKAKSPAIVNNPRDANHLQILSGPELSEKVSKCIASFSVPYFDIILSEYSSAVDAMDTDASHPSGDAFLANQSPTDIVRYRSTENATYTMHISSASDHSRELRFTSTILGRSIDYCEVTKRCTVEE